MDSNSKENLLQTQRSGTSSMGPPVSIPNPTFEDEDSNNNERDNQRDQVISNQDDVPGLDDDIILTPNEDQQQLPPVDLSEEGGEDMDGGQNKEPTLETSNNPDSSINEANKTSLYQKRVLEKGERYTDHASLDVQGNSQTDGKKLKGVKNQIPLKTMMQLNDMGGSMTTKNQQLFLSPKGIIEQGSGRSSINLSAWQHSNGPKNFLEVVKQQLDTQRPLITFYSKNPQNKMKGQKVINPHFGNHHQQQSRAHMNTQLNNNVKAQHPAITINGIANINQSGSMFSENDLSFSKDLIHDPNHNLMMVMVKQINSENDGVQSGVQLTESGANPFNASQFQENFIQKMELQSQHQINLMSEIKEHNESLEGSPRRIKGAAWLKSKRQSVAKVTMAFQGMEMKDKSAFLGQNNPFAKLEALARDRQKRLSDRIGNPIVEYLKKREELQNAGEHYSMNLLEAGGSDSPKYAPAGRIVHQNFNNHNKHLKPKNYSKTHAHSPSSGALGSPTEHGSDFKNPNSPSVSSIDQTMMQKPVMISHPVYYQPIPVALPLLDSQVRANNNTTATSFYSGGEKTRKYQKSIENKKTRSPVWLRGLSQKNEQPKMIAKPQMLFPLEPPIDEKSKNFNQTVHVDAAYLDASIIQSKGVKVRASMANYRAQKYLTFLQQKVNKEKAKQTQRSDDLHTVLEIPLNLTPQPMYADISQHHPNCQAVQKQSTHHNHLPIDMTSFNETFFSNDVGPSMLPVNGIQGHSPVKHLQQTKPPTKQKSQGLQNSIENSARGEPSLANKTIPAEPCLSKLPSLRTREISPRFNITVKDQHLLSKDQNSTVQGSPIGPQEMTFFNSKENNVDDVIVVLNPPGHHENITYGIGGSLHMSLEKPIEQHQPTQIASVQPANTVEDPSEPNNSSQLKDFMMPQHKYMKKSKLMEHKLHMEQQQNQRTNSQVMHKTSYHQKAGIKPKNFVGSGGFQRILGDDFTFNYENDLILNGKLTMTPGAIRGLAADEIPSPNQSFISYANRVRKGGAQQQQHNNHNNGKMMLLSSTEQNNSEMSHPDVIDLQGHKLTFAQKEIKKHQTQV